jgi:mRNA degradation ribonuclease J1/J2
MANDKVLTIDTRSFHAHTTFRIGAFSVTPYLMDHSAFDSYGFLVCGGGKSVFYSGDFRGHGRKAGLLDRLVKSPLGHYFQGGKTYAKNVHHRFLHC